MINSLSRYASSAIGLVDSDRGAIVTVLPSTPKPALINFTYIRLGMGDRLDQLARTLYGKEQLWWKIADANPEILDWTNVPAGTILRVPSAG